MEQQNIPQIEGGDGEYWEKVVEALSLIRQAEDAGERMNQSPLYVHGGYDEHGDAIPIENLGPCEDFVDAMRRMEKNRMAVLILASVACREMHGYRLRVVIDILDLLDDDQPENSPMWGPDTD
ncbi:MAG: hypothetical protein AB7P07_07650 [Hyphomonadaceae bacterium]